MSVKKNDAKGESIIIGIIHYWEKVFKIENSSGHKRYNLSGKVVKNSLSFQNSNSGCERILSTQNEHT